MQRKKHLLCEYRYTSEYRRYDCNFCYTYKFASRNVLFWLTLPVAVESVCWAAQFQFYRMMTYSSFIM
ncbi:hypothetical protein OUZ56_022891 [Daphnia magna]|uniref:Uncharacterized protein n=1 Tax=Daphnia magna TaxID=35525 RepID=A0ABR0AXS2_9CRUS|nr:hypothetical protein OUZ56_022891 [Daphnia magna]